AYDAELADDFVVPAAATWTVGGVDVQGLYYNGTAGPADAVNLRVYTNHFANLPGPLVASRLFQPYTGGASFAIALAAPIALGPGTYWLSVQAKMDYNPHGQWAWQMRTVQANAGAAWQNPGNGFATGCVSWTRRTQCIA